jgi:hypothetical protein
LLIGIRWWFTGSLRLHPTIPAGFRLRPPMLGTHDVELKQARCGHAMPRLPKPVGIEDRKEFRDF